jgi:hypothetical protein
MRVMKIKTDDNRCVYIDKAVKKRFFSVLVTSILKNRHNQCLSQNIRVMLEGSSVLDFG